MKKEQIEKIANDTIKLALSMKEVQGFATAMVDIKEYFNNDKNTENEFIKICKTKGFKAEYIEKSPFNMMPLKNKIVIWQ